MIKILLISTLFLVPFNTFSQSQKQPFPRKNWQLSSIEKDGLYGVDWEKATKLIGEMPITSIKVAILDNGVDIEHKALKESVYINKNEISNNGIDDDNNGYIDDVYGWNFLGSKSGNLISNNTEADREYYSIVTTKDTSNLSKDDLSYFNRLKESAELAKKQQSIYVNNRLKNSIDSIEKMLKLMYKGKPLIAGYLKNLPLHNTDDMFLNTAANIMLTKQKMMKLDDSVSVYKLLTIRENLSSRAVEDYEKYVMSNLKDFRQLSGLPNSGNSYGNSFVNLPISDHGTHVSGIIAGNDGGLEGVKGAVQIIPVRVVPQGDEYDLDVANGIFYAVNNGAKIINMSFGKYFSKQKLLVDSAIRYAQKKGVLLIMAAGNDARNTGEVERFPSQYFSDGQIASNVLIVGASDSLGRKAEFSNYGKKNVDLFAPGVAIYSSVVNNQFAYLNGTSMAAPVVSRVAALLLSRFPNTSPEEMISVLKKSVMKPEGNMSVEMESNCSSGGIINAYQAAVLLKKHKS